MDETPDPFAVVMRRLARLRQRSREAAARARLVAQGREKRELPTRRLKSAARRVTQKAIARRKARLEKRKKSKKSREV